MQDMPPGLIGLVACHLLCRELFQHLLCHKPHTSMTLHKGLGPWDRLKGTYLTHQVFAHSSLSLSGTS